MVDPFLKWVGGKRQLLEQLRAWYPKSFRRYIEPFVGSGAVFFDLHKSGAFADGARRAWLVDDNPDLVGCYEMVRDRTEQVIAALTRLETGHRARGADHYYEVRDGRFNPARLARGPYTPDLAAMLIYLNRTGFNGLFRLNRRGEFNVPAGRYANPRICDAERLRAVAAVLRQPQVAIERGSFERPLAAAGSGDFVYCDLALRPAQQDLIVCQLYRAGIFGRRPGPPPTSGHCGSETRRLRHRVEFGRARHSPLVQRPRSERCRARGGAGDGPSVGEFGARASGTDYRARGHERPSGTCDRTAPDASRRRRAEAPATQTGLGGGHPLPPTPVLLVRFIPARKWRNWQTRQT